MKAYTTIEQSKKLAKILPLETADMYYKYILPKSDKIHHVPEIGNPINSLKWYNEGYTFSGKRKPITLNDYCIPCWSLVALLDYLSPNFLIDIKNINYKWKLDCRFQVIEEEELVDACYEMIIKLHEQKVL